MKANSYDNIKRIAVWGPPSCGKTTLSLELAKELASSGKEVILLLCDRTLPVLPVLFPAAGNSELPSLGAALSALEIETGELLKSCAVCSEYPNLLISGYSVGENIYSYPGTGEGRAASLLDCASLLCDVVIIDCPPVLTGDPLASAAMKSAGSVIRLYSPDMRSFSFYDSQLPLFEGDEWHTAKHLRVLNVTSRDIYLPVDETRAHMLKCNGTLPYSQALRQAMSDGMLPGARAGKAYKKALQELLSVIGGGNEKTGKRDPDGLTGFPESEEYEK